MAALKDIRGNWAEVSFINLSGNKRLKISTHKVHSGVLVTSATVIIMENGFETHRMFQDYSYRVIVDRPKRVTSKVVEEQHGKLMDDKPKLLAIIGAAEAHYRDT